MNIVVHLFGPARDAVGGDAIEIEIVEGSTVAALLDAIRVGVPKLAPLLDASRLAVDLRYSSMEEIVVAGSEVALIPPVAGG